MQPAQVPDDQYEGPGSTAPTSWEPVDVAAALAGGVDALGPTHLVRADGLALLYPGKLHSFHGEGESMKSWCAQAVVADVLKAGRVALYIDPESEARDILGRLQALGVPADMLVANLLYVRPDGPLIPKAHHRLLAIADERMPEVTVIDGVDAAMEMEGMNPDKEFRRWLFKLARPLQKLTAGPTILVDHVVKNKDARANYAAGDRAKRNQLDATYGFEMVEQFGRGRTGLARIYVHKDKGGFVRAAQGAGSEVARLRMISQEDGSVTWELLTPSAVAGDTATDRPKWQPTYLMEQVSRYLELATKPVSGRDIESNVKGKAPNVRIATAELVSLGYASTTPGPRRSLLHRSVTPYREDDVSVRPDRVPTASPDGGTHSGGTASTASQHASPLKGGRTQDEVAPSVQDEDITADRVPGRTEARR